MNVRHGLWQQRSSRLQCPATATASHSQSTVSTRMQLRHVRIRSSHRSAQCLAHQRNTVIQYLIHSFTLSTIALLIPCITSMYCTTVATACCMHDRTKFGMHSCSQVQQCRSFVYVILHAYLCTSATNIITYIDIIHAHMSIHQSSSIRHVPTCAAQPYSVRPM